MRKLLIALALCFYACAAQAQLGWNFGDGPHRSNETFNRLNLGPANGNKILATGSTGIMLPTLTLPSVVQQNITQTGILTTDILAESGRPWADVRAFGAKGDSVTDDTAAFNAAIAAVTALGSGTIYVPPSTGSYCIKTAGGITLSAFGLRMVGATNGYYSSLDACGTDTTIVTMNNQYVSLEHILIAGKGINDTTTFGASQPTIKVTNACISCSIEHVNVTGGAFAIQGLGTPSQHVDDVMLFDVVAYQSYQTLIDIQDGGWWINRAKLDQNWPYSQPAPGIGTIPNWTASTAHSAGDLVITQNWIIQYMTSGTTGTTAPTLKNYGRTITDGTATAQIAQPSSQYYAIHFEGASETQMTQVDMSGSFYSGLYVDQDSSGNPSQYIECSQCIAGQTLNSAVYLNYGHSVYITDSHFGSCLYSGCGMVLVNGSYTGDFNMEGGAFLGTGIGALVGGSGGTTFQGVTFNGQSTGIQMNACSNLTAVGNRLGVSGTGSLGTIMTGIAILSGANHYTVLGNMCVNVTTCVSDNGGGVDKAVQAASGVALSGIGLSFQQPDTGSLSTTLYTKFAYGTDIMVAPDFCAFSNLNGAADNTSCVQAAITAACNRSPLGEIKVVFPTGTYNISAATGLTVPCNGIWLEGMGWGTENGSTPTTGTWIVATGTQSGTTPLIWFTGAGASGRHGQYAEGAKISNLSIHMNGSSQSGPAIEFDHQFMGVADHVQIYNPFIGFENYAGDQSTISNSSITQVAQGGTGIINEGSDNPTRGITPYAPSGNCYPSNVGNCPHRADNFQIMNMELDSTFPSSGASTTTCIATYDFAASTYISRAVCGQFQYGLYSRCLNDQAIATCPQFFKINDLENEMASCSSCISTGGGVNIDMVDFVHFECDDCAMFGYGQNASIGVQMNSSRFANQSANVKFNGGTMVNYGSDCFYIGVNQVVIQGMTIYQCGVTGVSTNGVELTNQTDYIISNNHFCNFMGSAPTSMTAIRIDSGVDWVTAVGNDFHLCSAGVNNAGSASHTNISNLGP
jgi:hypothetical protein